VWKFLGHHTFLSVPMAMLEFVDAGSKLAQSSATFRKIYIWLAETDEPMSGWS
jgi:hypothetical protein